MGWRSNLKKVANIATAGVAGAVDSAVKGNYGDALASVGTLGVVGGKDTSVIANPVTQDQLRGLPIIGDYLAATDPPHTAAPNLNVAGIEAANAGVGATADLARQRYEAGSAIGPAGVVAAPTVQPTTVGPAAQAGNVMVNQQQANRARNIQMSSIQQLQDIAQGKGPDLASPTLQAGLRTTAGEALGAASAASGGERAALRLEALQAIGRGGTDAAVEAARIKAIGQQSALAALGTQAAGIRQQDLGVAGLQAQIDAARASGNATEANRLTALQGQITNNEATNNASNALTADTGNANRALDRDVQVAADTRGQGSLAVSAGGTNIQGAQAVSDTMAKGEQIAADRDEVNAKAAAAGRQAWTDGISTVAKAAHGGLVTKPTHVIAGEAGPELILPVRNVPKAAARNLSLEAQPFDRSGAPNLSRVLHGMGGHDDGRGLNGDLADQLLAGLLLERKDRRAREGGR